jgi:protein TonB
VSQLDFRHEDTLIVIRDLEKKHHNTNLSYYLLSMATLSLMACESNPKLPPTKPKTEQTEMLGEVRIDETCQKSDKKEKFDLTKIDRKFGEEIRVVEGTVDGGMMIEPPKMGGAMEVEIVAPEPVLVGDIAMDSKPRMIVEKMPEFPGGTEALMTYIHSKLKYPKWEKRHNIQGTVYATFVVNERGEITNPQILKSVEGSENFDQEVIQLLNRMPRWKPGEDRGEIVPVQFNLPFRFQL